MTDPAAVALLRDLLDVDHDSAGAEPRPPAYTVESLAIALGMSAKAVRNAIARGDLAAVKRAGRWLISAEAVDAWTRPAQPRRMRRRSIPKSGGPLTETFQRLDHQAQSS